MSSAEVSDQLRRALIKFIIEALKQAHTGEGNHFQKLKYELDCTVKKRNPKNITRWYTVLTDCVHWLSPKPEYRSLMDIIFQRFDWDLEHETVKVYTNFLIALYTHDVRFVKNILTSLVWNLCPRLDRDELFKAAGSYNKFINPNLGEEKAGSKEGVDRINHIHEVLCKMRTDYSPTPSFLMPTLVKLFPHKFRQPHVFKAYVRALHRIIINMPELRDRIFELIMSRVAYMDFELWRLESRARKYKGSAKVSVLENVFHPDKCVIKERLRLDPEMRRRLRSITGSLDILISELFDYIRSVHRKRPEDIHSIFLEVLRVFQDGLLTTRTKTVQFILFYLASFDTTMAEEFLMRLLKLGFDHGESSLKRRCATNYAAALICKANFLRFASCMASFDHMVKWSIEYVSLYHDRFGTDLVPISVAEYHELFYTMCQAVFLIFCYRRDAFESKQSSDGSFSESARIHGLDVLINSALQPLMYCNKQIVKEFVLFCWQNDMMCNLPAMRECQEKLYQEEMNGYSNEESCSKEEDMEVDKNVAKEDKEDKQEKEKPKSKNTRVNWRVEDSKRVVTFPFDEFYLPKCSRYIFPLFRRYEFSFSCPSPSTKPSTTPGEGETTTPGEGDDTTPGEGDNAMDTATPILNNIRSPNLENVRTLEDIPEITL